MIAAEKARLRREIARWEGAQSRRALQESDSALFRRFLALPELAEAETVLLFWGMGAEPETARLAKALVEQGKVLGLPRCLPGGAMEFRRFQGESALIRHPYGMLEPAASAPLLSLEGEVLALIPALCYDRRCMRLGRGGGYYDRLLPRFSGTTVGLCRAALLQDALPAEGHDRGVDMVLTEQALFLCTPQAR